LLGDLTYLSGLSTFNVMMVCLGNICRSPMAAAILNSKASKITEFKIVVGSSGTSNWHVGEGANPASERTWERAGYSYKHIASQLDQNRIKNSDLLLVMDSFNFSEVKKIASVEDQRKIFYLRSFDQLASDLEVPDPYGSTDQAFEEVLEMIERATDGLINVLYALAPSDT
jgi:protein-tyrosine phosphatase